MLFCHFNILFCLFALVGGQEPSFTIDYEGNTFLRNGHPHRYVSGSMHYVRVMPEVWRDRMIKMRLAGLNTLQTYVEWSSHEPSTGKYNFDGLCNLDLYLETAQQVGLDVILRPGPFIDAERDFGGLPYWLLSNRTDSINLRTSNDKMFLESVERWYKVLFKRLQKYLFKNGGPIVMIQVENEYGSYGLQTNNCDKEYLTWLRDLIRTLIGDNVLLFTTDGASNNMVMCGKVAGVYATVDFGCGGNVEQAFHTQRLFEPQGPLVNSEYYSGWLDHWGSPHSKVSTECVVSGLDKMLDKGANVNIYMFHGGTSFGFGSGSNNPPFAATPTSYDYDAPISEAGDLTAKFWAIRSTVGKYLPLPPIPPNLKNSTDKGAYGLVSLVPAGSILDSIPGPLSHSEIISDIPLTFEDLGQSNGIVVYKTIIPVGVFPDPVLLSIPTIRDRGTIFLNRNPLGVLSREQHIYNMPIQVQSGQELIVVVENQGRLCFGPKLADKKGILGKVMLGSTNLTNWTTIGISLSEGQFVDHFVKKVVETSRTSQIFKEQLALSISKSEGKLTIWQGNFSLGSMTNTLEIPKDTFISLKGWHKGFVWINGFNLGRYWPVVGPQITLYLPASLLKQGPEENSLVILEQDHTPCLDNPQLCHVELVDQHDIDGLTPNSS